MPKEQFETNSLKNEGARREEIDKKLYAYVEKRAGEHADLQFLIALTSGNINLGSSELDKGLSHAFYFTPDEGGDQKRKYHGRIPEREQRAIKWATHKTNQMAEKKSGAYPRMPEFIESFLEGAEDENIQKEIQKAMDAVSIAEEKIKGLYKGDFVSVDEVEKALKEIINRLPEALEEIQKLKTDK